MLLLGKGTSIKNKVVGEISGNQRSKQGFHTYRFTTYKIVKNHLVAATGQTVDKSSGGMTFTANETFRMLATVTGQDQQRAGQPPALQLEFDQIDGELDATVVFAAAGNNEYHKGNPEFGDAALADAHECYQSVIAGLYKSGLTGERRRHLDEKVNCVREFLAISGGGGIGVEVTVASSESAV